MKKKSKIDPKDLMAVERATTALLGTAISLTILGFVVEKFELFLHLITLEIKDTPAATIPQLAHIPFYNYLGVSIITAGILLALYTYRYYVRWIYHLEHNEINTDKNIYLLLSFFIALIGIVLVAGMLMF